MLRQVLAKPYLVTLSDADTLTTSTVTYDEPIFNGSTEHVDLYSHQSIHTRFLTSSVGGRPGTRAHSILFILQGNGKIVCLCLNYLYYYYCMFYFYLN